MQFDANDPSNMGRPIYWDLDVHIRAIEQMIRADEIQLALEMCDKVPAWYREHHSKDLDEIRKAVCRQIYDQIEYATDDEEAFCERVFGESQWRTAYTFPRAEIVSELVKSIDCPWIFDLGCSHGNLPLGLIKDGLKFHYKGVGMNWRIVEKVKGWAGDHWREKPSAKQSTILFCSEVLEHASRVEDVVHTAHKTEISWDHIILSMPYCTLGGGLPNWRDRRLGHVRTWNSREFFDFADKSWPGYKWELTLAPSMVLKGVRA